MADRRLSVPISKRAKIRPHRYSPGLAWRTGLEQLKNDNARGRDITSISLPRKTRRNSSYSLRPPFAQCRRGIFLVEPISATTFSPRPEFAGTDNRYTSDRHTERETERNRDSENKSYLHKTIQGRALFDERNSGGTFMIVYLH